MIRPNRQSLQLFQNIRYIYIFLSAKLQAKSHPKKYVYLTGGIINIFSRVIFKP